jgi:hypothetical protein
MLPLLVVTPEGVSSLATYSGRSQFIVMRERFYLEILSNRIVG